MKIGIYFNQSQTDLSVAENLLRILEEKGAVTTLFHKEEEICNVDRLIVLGGDGTVLRAAKRTAEHKIPLFGINYGHIGFLTEFERDETEDAAAFALLKDCDSLDRAMLDVELNGTHSFCLNECSLQRNVTPSENKVVKIGVQIDGCDAGDILADGIIVATPTGSSAYSLSAGGSILMPECEAFSLTPVCAISLRSRPIVYSSSSELSFSIPEGDLMLFGDGKYLGEVRAGDVVLVRKATRTATFLTRNKKGYFLKITKKIN